VREGAKYFLASSLTAFHLAKLRVRRSYTPSLKEEVFRPSKVKKAVSGCEMRNESDKVLCTLKSVSAAKATYELRCSRGDFPPIVALNLVNTACYNRFKNAGIKFASESNQLTYRDHYPLAIPQKELEKEEFKAIIKQNEMLSRFVGDEVDTLEIT
jgi:hypothetical protein